MKQLVLALSILAISFPFFLHAQLDTKVTTAVVEYNQQNYKKTIANLDLALADISQLKEKNIPKAYYYRGKAILNYLSVLARKASAEGLTTEEENSISEAPVKAYNDFKNAKKYDDGKWGDKVDSEMGSLNTMFLQAGLNALNLTYGNISTSEKKLAQNNVVEYMTYAKEINPNNYIAYDLLGQAQLGLKDSTSAYTSFSKAIQVFEAHKPSTPDQLIAYASYRKALLERYAQNDLDAALASIEHGKAMLESEHQRVVSNKGTYTEKQFSGLAQQYNNATQDLNNFELDILLNSPDKLEQAKSKFENAISSDPTNYMIHVAYAQLLENTDPNRAVEIYQKAIDINPDRQIANFNLGAMYVNAASQYFKQANAEDDYSKADELQKQGNVFLQSALPYMVKAHEINKCDRTTLDALMNITINLEMTDDYIKYKEAKKACGY